MTDQRISINKVVQFTYTILDEDSNVVEQVDLPVHYVHGASNVGLIEPVERALNGARVGDKIEATVPAAQGFGEYDASLTVEDDIDNVPPQFRKIGMKVEMANDDGETKEFVITKIEDGKVTIDGNHPLAGKTAKFVVSVLSVRDATADEIKNGVSNDNVGLH